MNPAQFEILKAAIVEHMNREQVLLMAMNDATPEQGEELILTLKNTENGRVVRERKEKIMEALERF